MCYGHSNAGFIIAENSVILIDTLDSDERAQTLKSLIAQYTDKSVKTIVYTHGHPDHRGGAGAFMDSAWVDTLDKLIAYRAHYLLPGHTLPITGETAVQETLTNFRDAIDYVLTETLKGMNQGLTVDEVAEAVKLPDRWAGLPYLGEFYGTVSWSVRGIYTGYVGWFDGNPTHLNPLPPAVQAQKTVALMGGAEAVLSAIRQALADQDYQWSIVLADLLLAMDRSHKQAKECKAQGLVGLGHRETSANGRHYYLAYAKELLAECL